MGKMLSGKKGFTLLELAVVLAALALVSTAAIPFFIRRAEITAANRTAKEISTIQEASKWYYVNNKAWPASVETLKTAGFLNPSWTSINPWGNSYATSDTGTSFTVTTFVPAGVEGILARALPGASTWASGSWRGVSSVVPVPGQEASLSSVTSLASTALSTANSAMSLAQSSSLPPCCQITVPHAGGQGVGTTCPNGYVMIGTVNEFSKAQIPRNLICGKVAR